MAIFGVIGVIGVMGGRKGGLHGFAAWCAQKYGIPRGTLHGFLRLHRHLALALALALDQHPTSFSFRSIYGSLVSMYANMHILHSTLTCNGNFN